MQLHSTVDDRRHGNQGAHVGVHLLVHQPEGQALIADQSLKILCHISLFTADSMLIICTVKRDAVPDRDFLHRQCTSLHIACWSVCEQYCPCSSLHPLTPSGSTR